MLSLDQPAWDEKCGAGWRQQNVPSFLLRSVSEHVYDQGVEGGLAEAIDELLTVDVAGLDDEALHEAVVGLQRQSSRLAAARARVVSQWDARRVWAADGSRSAGARLARDARCAPVTARAEVRRARRLRTIPVTRDAFASGDLSVDHVDVLAGVNHKPYEELLARDEALLVGHAKTLRFSHFCRAVKYWRDCADDDVADDDAQDRFDRRYLRTRPTTDDMVDVQGRLDPMGAAVVVGELERVERMLFEADWASAKAVHGDDVCLDRLARTAEQRRADALVELCRRSAAMAPDARPARVLLTVLVGYETFAGRICELANGTVVTPGQVASLFTNADGTPNEDLDVERIVFDGPSRVIDVGVRTRVFTGGLRRAVEVRDRHCAFPGCEIPEQCQVDHIIEWANGGPTSQENGRLLCPAHNRQRPGRTTPPAAGP